LIDISGQRYLRGFVPVKDRAFVEIQVLDNDVGALDVQTVNGFRAGIGFIDKGGVNPKPP
jgi:hypothetical protein